MAVMHRSAMCSTGASTRSLQPAGAPRSVLNTRTDPKGRRPQRMHVSASSDRGGGFTAGFLVGGVIFGSLGFLFAPQISKALLTEDQKLKLPRFLEDEVRDPEATKQELSDKIASLNLAIDEVANQMKAKDPKPVEHTVEEVTA